MKFQGGAGVIPGYNSLDGQGRATRQIAAYEWRTMTRLDNNPALGCSASFQSKIRRMKHVLFALLFSVVCQHFLSAQNGSSESLRSSPKVQSTGVDWAVFNQKREAVWSALVDTMTSYNWRPQTLDATSGVVFFQSDGKWGEYWGANNALVARFTTKHVGRMATWMSVALQTNARVKALDEFHTEVRFTVKYAGCNGAQALFDQYSKCHWEPLESNGALESEMLTQIASHLTSLSDSELNPPSKPESNVVTAAHDEVVAFQKLSATFELNAPPDRILSALVDTKASFETFSETPESRTLPKFTAALSGAMNSYVQAANATGEQRSSLLEAAEGSMKEAKKCLQNYRQYVQEVTPASVRAADQAKQEVAPQRDAAVHEGWNSRARPLTGSKQGYISCLAGATAAPLSESPGGETLSMLHCGEKVAVFEDESVRAGWSVIETSDGKVGVIRQSFLSGVTASAPTKPAPPAPLSQSSAAVALKESDSPAFAQSNSPTSAQVMAEFWSDPVGADIEMDGKHIGTTPATVLVESGQHTVTLRKKDFQSWDRTVTITSGKARVGGHMQRVGLTLQ